jgi:hypothetical protein
VSSPGRFIDGVVLQYGIATLMAIAISGSGRRCAQAASIKPVAVFLVASNYLIIQFEKRMLMIEQQRQ